MPKKTSKTEVRRLLRSIETVLMRRDCGSQALWHILTALRGPDTAAYSKGKENTIAVRRAAFPRIGTKSTYANGAAFVLDGWATPLARKDLLEIPHFGYHTDAAANALRNLAAKGRLWA